MPTSVADGGVRATVGPKEDTEFEFLWKWRKYLLLLATLVASVTYVAGLNPPGGVRSDDGGPGRDHVVGVDPPLPPHRAGVVDPPLPSHRAGFVDPALPPAVYPNRVGDPVLVTTYSRRYTAFFYCNAAAFVASLVVIMFLLDRRISNNPAGLTVLRLAMLLDLLALMAAFAAGSCRDVVASIYVSALFALVFAYVAVHVCVARAVARKQEAISCPWPRAEESHLKERRKFLLLLATFATPLTYGAGLAPPGGFWSETENDHRAGAPLLHDGTYKIRYHSFFYANASSFVASLAIIMLLMSRSLSDQLARYYALPVCVLAELLGLMAAFAAGSCRFISTTAYIISLVGAVLLYIVLQVAIAVFAIDRFKFKQWRKAVCRILTCSTNLPRTDVRPPAEVKLATPELNTPPAPAPAPGNAITNAGGIQSNNGDQAAAAAKVEASRSLLLLLATLAATMTYQAGLSPPGGVWPEGRGHTAGDPVLLDTHPKRYKAFYHCNTAAFVASLVVIIIVQSKELSSGPAVKRRALNTVMILGLLGLMGAYVAGSCRDNTTTIYVFALAVAVFVYSIAKVVVYTAYGQSRLIKWLQRVGMCLARTLLRAKSTKGGDDDNDHLERKRKFLLQLAILAATVTYQTGLNPPGGFWPESNEAKNLTAGDPVLLDYYWTRYQVFFYCNATGFMASITVILLLVNQTLSKQGIRSSALHVCILVGLLALMGAYAAGSCRKLRTSIYVFSLVAAVVTFLVLQILLWASADRERWSDLPWLPTCVKWLLKPLAEAPAPDEEKRSQSKELTADQQRESEKYMRRKYLMLLGILGASVTYQAGLAPPGGTWGDDDSASSPSPSPAPSPSGVAGNPILLDSNASRYQAFFYCNATSFVASIVVIMLLLLRTIEAKQPWAPLWAMQTAVVLDLLGLLGAYAAGSCRDWETSAYVIALVAVVVIFIVLHVLLSIDAVLKKAKKLPAWRYCGGGDDHKVQRNGAELPTSN